MALKKAASFEDAWRAKDASSTLHVGRCFAASNLYSGRRPLIRKVSENCHIRAAMGHCSLVEALCTSHGRGQAGHVAAAPSRPSTSSNRPFTAILQSRETHAKHEGTNPPGCPAECPGHVGFRLRPRCKTVAQHCKADLPNSFLRHTKWLIKSSFDFFL